MISSAASKGDLKTKAYLALKERLINCVYAPGSVLNEVQLASELGLSRTPIREAIGRLEMDGYVRVLPKKGIYVTDISLNDVMQIFQTRIEIEPLTLRLSAPHLSRNELLMFRNRFEEETSDILNSFRLDTAMHLFFIEHCGNKYLIDMMRKLFDDNTRIIIASKQNQTKIHDAKCEHLQILDSLLAKDDIQHTAELMRTHIETCKKAALHYFYSLNFMHETPDTAHYKNELSKLL